MLRFAPLLLLLLPACGGPALEGKTVATRKLVGTAQCSQAPIVAEFTATGSKYGEGIVIRACSPQGFDGRVRISAGSESLDWGKVSSASDAAQHAQCRSATAESASRSLASSSTTTTTSGGPAVSPSAAPGSTASTSRDFVDYDFDVSDACFGSPTTVLQLWPMTKGTPIKVELWSAVPNYVLGTKIAIRHKSYWPNVSEKEWAKHIAKKEKNARARDRSVDDDGEWTVVTNTGPTSPPPPAKSETRPPRPSLQVHWRPGYWHWTSSQWLWIAGAWQKSSAPVAIAVPPAPRRERQPASPGAGYLWVPGHYSFDGLRFQWVAGVWLRGS